ncbi:MAG: MGMT family protein [Chloroflexota bacterium]|nr:MGMT family protein [Chloroflexota bacterium]
MRASRQADLPDVLKLRIYEVVQQVPAGAVSTYGDIAAIVGGGIDAWTIGQALNQIPKQGAEAVPWQRIVNAQGGISTKGLLQRKLLQDEGILFDDRGRIDLRRFRWTGPSAEWAAEHGYQPLPPPDEPAAEQLSLL